MEKVSLKTDLATAKKIFEKSTPEFKEILISTFGAECFSQNIMDRVKTFEQAYMLANKETRDEYDNDKCVSIDAIAYKKLRLIIKVLNEDWILDWTNHSQYKYFPYHEVLASGLGFSVTCYDCRVAGSSCGGSLYLSSSELAEYCGKQFIDLYSNFILKK